MATKRNRGRPAPKAARRAGGCCWPIAPPLDLVLYVERELAYFGGLISLLKDREYWHRLSCELVRKRAARLTGERAKREAQEEAARQAIRAELDRLQAKHGWLDKTSILQKLAALASPI